MIFNTADFMYETLSSYFPSRVERSHTLSGVTAANATAEGRLEINKTVTLSPDTGV